MGATSWTRFMGIKNGNGRGQLHWGRADIDGAPFRGSAPLMGTEEELESRLTRVYDSKNRVFNTNDQADNAAYLAVLDKITNGWAILLNDRVLEKCIEKIRGSDGVIRTRLTVFVYMEWAEPFMEDGKPALAQRPYIGRSNAGI